jgi:hypothetical protein
MMLKFVMLTGLPRRFGVQGRLAPVVAWRHGRRRDLVTGVTKAMLFTGRHGVTEGHGGGVPAEPSLIRVGNH